MDDESEDDEDVIHMTDVEYAKYILDTSAASFAEALYVLTQDGYDVDVGRVLQCFREEVLSYLSHGSETH
jgi:hypothetical protein